MPILSQLLLDSLRAKQEQNQLLAMRERLSPHIRGLMGTAPRLQDLPPGQAGPPEITDRGSGLLANPGGLTEQLQFGAGLMEMPALVQPGSRIISEALARSEMQQQAIQDRAMTQEMQRERLAQQAAEHKQTFDAREYWDNLRNARADRTEARAQEQADRALIGGTTGEGMALGFLPSGEPVHYGISGSKPWRTAVGRLETAQGGLELIDELIGRVENVGSENWGKEAARMDSLRGEIISLILQRRGYGTPQEGELERIEGELRGHAGLKNFARKGTILASLQQARELFRRSLLQDRQEFRHWPTLREYFRGDFSGTTNLPPGTVPYTGPARTTPVPRSQR